MKGAALVEEDQAVFLVVVVDLVVEVLEMVAGFKNSGTGLQFPAG